MPCAKNPKITWLDELRFIGKYAIDGCSTTLKVYVETFVQADTNLVLGIVNTSPEDFVRFLLRPKGARTARHGIRGLSRNEALADDELFPDTAKLAADTIHAVTGWHVPSWGALGDALFEIARPVERGAFFLILANVTEDFAFDWYSGILMSPESKCDIGRFAFIGSDVPVGDRPMTFIPPGVTVFPPDNAHEETVGVWIEEGSWCITIEVGADEGGFPLSNGTLRCSLYVGWPNEAACGGEIILDLEEHFGHINKKFVRKVSGPDFLRFKYSIHWDNPASSLTGLSVLYSGFQI